MRTVRLLVVSLFLFAAVVPSPAATQNAVVYGTVYDAAGNPMPGVTVVLENAALGFSRSSATSSDGSYNFAEVPPADGYRLTASKDGKTLDIRAGISVNVGDERVILPPLKEQAAVATGAQVVEQKAAPGGARLETVSTTISGVITGDQLRSLPLYNRNFLVLGLLTPNVRDVEPGSELAGASFSVSGNRPTTNNFLLDGADNVASSSNQAVPFQVNDAVQEFRVISATATAEFGRNRGGVVNIVTRRGDNAFHGSAYGYFANDAFNADSPVSVYNGTTFDQNAAFAGDPGSTTFSGFPLTYNSYVATAELLGYCTDSITSLAGGAGNCVANGLGANTRFNPAAILAANDSREIPFDSKQFGVNMGGPLIKDKWFAFGSYEGTRIDNPNPVFERVPSDFDRTCDPFGTGLTPGMCAGQDRAIADAVMGLFPASNVVAVPGVLEFFRGEAPNYTHVHNVLFRTDYKQSDNDNWSLRYVVQSLNQLHDATLPPNSNYPGNGVVRDALNQNLAISYSRTISANILNEARVGFNRFNVEETPQDAGFDATTLGLPNSLLPTIFLNGIDAQYSGAIAGLSGAFTTWRDCCNQFPTLDYQFPFARLGAPLGAPAQRLDTTLFASDNLSWAAGKHTLKFGIEGRHLRNRVQNDAFSRGFIYSSNIGEFTSNSEDCNEGCPGNAFVRPSFDFAQFVPDPYEAQFRSYAVAGYFQDTWRVHPRVTINFGARYEYYSVPMERDDRTWNFDPSANGLVQQNRTGPVLDPYGNTCGNLPAGPLGVGLYQAVPEAFSGSALFLDTGSNLGTPGSFFFTLPFGWNCDSTGSGKISDSDRNNIMPRAGMAWDLWGDGKTVVRLGYGVYYDHLPVSYYSNLIYNRPMTDQNTIHGRIQSVLLGPSGAIGFCQIPLVGFFNAGQCGLGNSMLDPNVQAATSPDGINSNSFYSLAQQPFAVNAIDVANSRTPYNHQFSGTVQQSITDKFAIEVGYIGVLGRQLPLVYNSNYTNEWDISRAATTFFLFQDNFSTVPIFTRTNQGESNFHSLMVRGRVDGWHGLRLGAAYSMANSEDNTPSPLHPVLPLTGPNTLLPYNFFHDATFTTSCIYAPSIPGFCPSGISPVTPNINFTPGAVTTTGAGQVLVSRYSLPQDPFNFLSSELGRSDFHTKHRFVLDYTWDVPTKDWPTWLQNWQVSGILIAQSGQPFTIFAGILNEITQRVNTTGPVAVTNNPDGAISSANLQLPFEAPGSICAPGGAGFGDGILLLPAARTACTGQSARNQFTGPNFVTFNLAIQKAFKVFGEGRTLTFRTEFYNLTNHENFFNPISLFSTNGVTHNPDFGKIKSAHEPRQIQFAVRFTW